MKNRYKIENNIIKELDASYTAPEFYLTDDNLQVTNENGIPQYKIVGGVHVSRSQSEIDVAYLPIYSIQKIDEMESHILERLLRWSIALPAIQAKFNNVFIVSVEGAVSLAEVDAAYNDMITWLNTPL